MTPRPRPAHLLVTGGAGFIGSAFVRQRLALDADLAITVLDRVGAGSGMLVTVSSNERLRLVEGDICDRELVDTLARDVDAIVNVASESPCESARPDAAAWVRTNVVGTSVLLEAARRYRHQRFIQVSTSELYRPSAGEERGEDHPLRADTPYLASKVGGEMLVQAYHRSHDLPGLITRGACTYGPYQSPDALIPSMITNARRNLPLRMRAGGAGIRPYIHVDDHVAGIACVLARGEPGKAYNISAGPALSDRQVAETVLRLTGKPVPQPSGPCWPDSDGRHGSRVELDTRRLRSLGWEAQYGFEAGMGLTVDWYVRREMFVHPT